MSTAIQRHPVGITWVESGTMARAAHAVLDGEQVWLIDPFEDAAALSAAAELGRPAGVIQLLDRHERDGEAIAERLLVGHGPALPSGATEALSQALSAARSDIPKLLAKLPSVIRGG